MLGSKNTKVSMRHVMKCCCAIALFSLFSACGEAPLSALPPIYGDAALVQEFRRCVAPPPPRDNAAGFQFRSNRLKSWSGANHMTQDAIVRPYDDVTLKSTFSYGPLGLKLAQERVTASIYDCANWRELAQMTTNDTGDIEFAFSAADYGPGEFTVNYQVLGDATGLTSAVHVVPEGTHFVVFDIDGTLTTGDFGLLRDLFYQSLLRREFRPVAHPYAATLTKLWQQKGYRIAYVTGRPLWLRQMTEEWLKDAGFATGTLHFTESRGATIPSVKGVGTYKAAYLQSLRDKGYELDYAYGNATTDIYAYKKVQVRRVFFLGTTIEAGVESLIEYAKHLDIVRALPDAPQPYE